MRVQFVIKNDINNTIDIEVASIPTEEQVREIENEIWAAMEEYEEETGDSEMEDFDYYECCYEAIKKVMGVKHNRVIRTIYI